MADSRGRPRTHDLKVRREFLLAIREGRKTCEVRFNDRDYREGDYLRLRDEKGDELFLGVSHMVDLADVAGQHVAPGWVVLSVYETVGGHGG